MEAAARISIFFVYEQEKKMGYKKEGTASNIPVPY
jgi:hypothetical protein